MLDTRTALETPEGIDLNLTVAGPIPRGLAWALDFLIRLGIYIGLILVLAQLEAFGIGLAMIAAFVLEWFYPVLFETLNHGVTPGKKALGLKVVHDDGSPVSWNASLIRNLLRAADFLPAFYALGSLISAFRPDFKRLGDIAAGTLVIYADKPPQAHALPPGEAEAPRVSLRLAEQQALLAFAERAPRLSPERQAELARLLVPELAARPETAVQELLAQGRWLAGPTR
ncbi:MAG: RDD family protein [Gammaproteobacteria bacterium]|nr:RDD family protein [Gammaproteobacteria bacterium]